MRDIKKNPKNKYVGIPGWIVDTKRSYFGASVNHLEFISYCGGIPRIIFPEEDLANVDMIYLPGGPDLSPDEYGQNPGFRNSDADQFRMHFFKNKLKLYVQAEIPIFGVCLGMQSLNVFFGGTLDQNLYGHPSSKERYEKGHTVTYVNLAAGKKEEFDVNSHHHQGVDELGEGLVPECFYNFKEGKNNKNSEYSLIESFVHKTLPIVGVQWHPEEFYDPYSINKFKKLLNYEPKKI